MAAVVAGEPPARASLLGQRVGPPGWAAWALAVFSAAAASQFVGWLWIGERAGISSSTSRVTLAAVGVAVMVAYCERPLQALPVPGPPCPVYSGIEKVVTLGGAFVVKLLVVSPIVALVRWTFDPALVGTEAAPPGTGWVTVAGEVWRGAVVPAVSEEFVFRFLLLIALARVMSIRRAVLVQAVVFAAAHTSFGFGFGIPGATDRTYLVDGFVSTGLMALLFGYLTVELATIWPAIVLHVAGNAMVELRYVGGVWLDIVLMVVAFTAVVVVTVLGLLGLSRRIDLPDRRRYGLSVDQQRRLEHRFGPLMCQAPFLRRPLTWADEAAFADWPTIRAPQWWPGHPART